MPLHAHLEAMREERQQERQHERELWLEGLKGWKEVQRMQAETQKDVMGGSVGLAKMFLPMIPLNTSAPGVMGGVGAASGGGFTPGAVGAGGAPGMSISPGGGVASTPQPQAPQGMPWAGGLGMSPAMQYGC